MYCDECKDQAHAEKEELIRQRDRAYGEVDQKSGYIQELADAVDDLLAQRDKLQLQVEALQKIAWAARRFVYAGTDREMLQRALERAVDEWAVEKRKCENHHYEYARGVMSC